MYKDVSFRYKGKKFSFKAKKCNSFDKFRGLMFRAKNNSFPLIFEFNSPTRIKIHSFFVFFPFVAVWLDRKNRVVDVKRVSPFTVAVGPKKPFLRLLEIPTSGKYQNRIKSLR